MTTRRVLMAKLANVEYAECMRLGHGWQAKDDVPNDIGGWDENTYCPRCTTWRTRVMDRRGYVIARRYLRPKDYGIKGMGVWDADMRAALRTLIHRQRDG
jgi:hypothetical protein